MADTKIPAPASPPPNHNKITWLLVAGLAFVVVVGGVLMFHPWHSGQKVYAEAAGHKIYKKDIQSLQVVNGQKKDVTDHQAATVLAEKYLTEAMSKQQGVKITK